MPRLAGARRLGTRAATRRLWHLWGGVPAVRAPAGGADGRQARVLRGAVPATIALGALAAGGGAAEGELGFLLAGAFGSEEAAHEASKPFLLRLAPLHKIRRQVEMGIDHFPKTRERPTSLFYLWSVLSIHGHQIYHLLACTAKMVLVYYMVISLPLNRKGNKLMAETAVAPKNQMPAHVSATIRMLRPTLEPLLPPDITAEQFRAALFLELQVRPALYECLPDSLRDCAIKAAMNGMLPGRDVHFLPFTNRRKGGKKEATFVPNYFGIILALERSGKVRRAFAHAVREGDSWEFDMFANRPKHTPAVALGQKPGKALFYYGAVMFHDGTCAFEIMTLEDLDAVKKRSPAGEQSVWLTDEDMMRRKTCIKRVAKYVKLTPEVRDLLEADVEREKNDIPPERVQTNIVDLFGDQPEGQNGTAHTPVKNITPSGKGDTTPSDWRTRVEELASYAKGEFGQQVWAALEDADYPEDQGQALAMQLADLAAADEA